ncbi:DUF5682 family protein [Corynebacterium sp. H130]|uniref:DUF5682 family protein n=1 Tax=Corynebacterium sp. H130 TaxID=3133444 RepID=UPI0030990C76
MRNIDFFGVRHHSPTGALLVAERIRTRPPAAVLIEGPTEFNEHMPELALDHTLPIMIYSWAPDGEGRRGVYYPLSSYSPEWQAIRTAAERNIPVRFIDAPFYLKSRNAESSAKIPDDLLRRLGVDDIDAAIDELIDIQADLSYAEYCTRMETFGAMLRSTDEATLSRERFMADRIRETMAETNGTILVICGAAHIEGLRTELARHTEPSPWHPPTDPRYGCALTPTSYAALDALRGYRAGQPNPGFYAALFDDRSHGIHHTAERLLRTLISDLRNRNQRVSVADAIAVLTSAKGLAALRGHPEVWRTDLLDAMTMCLVKDDRGQQHPLVAHIEELLRGNEVGALAAGSTRPPFVIGVLEELQRFGLMPQVEARVLQLNVRDSPAQSQLLHSLGTLGVVGFVLDTDPDLTGAELWRIEWSPQFESTLVEASRYGGSREEAVTTRVLESLAKVEDDPERVAELLLAAVRCGVVSLIQKVRSRCEELIATSTELPALAKALETLVDVHRFRNFAFVESPAVGDLIGVGHRRFSELLLALPPAAPDASKPVIDAILSSVAVLERCADVSLSIALWRSAMEATTKNPSQPTAVRGAATGALWVMSNDESCESITTALKEISDPANVGDFVYGLLRVARELVVRKPEFVAALDAAITDMGQEDFLAALPGLRLAFSAYPPRERAGIAVQVLGEQASTAMQAFDATVEEAAQVMAWEENLRARIRTFLGAEND